MRLEVKGKFVLDPAWNPPPLREIQRGPGGLEVSIGRGVWLALRDTADPLDALLDLRVKTAAAFTGLGSVTEACALMCATNRCLESHRMRRRPRVVAKIVGVMADEPRYVLLSQPLLRSANRARRESRANRVEAGLVHAVLTEPAVARCPECPSNIGEVAVAQG